MHDVELQGIMRVPEIGSQTPTSPMTEILAMLRSLTPSGPDGFEGFVADALSEVSGLSFRLVKSGTQAGADLVSRGRNGEATVAVEAKRFGEDTHLPFDQLQAKIFDVGRNRLEVDIWVLAASRQIAADDAAKLVDAGASFGIDVLILDTRLGAQGLSPLEVLCAGAPRTVAMHCPNQPILDPTLESTSSGSGLAAALGEMRMRLASPEIGYDSARSAMAAWMRRVMSDLASAKAGLGCHADLRADGARRGIDRQTATKHLAAAIADPTRPHALLGFEGSGKTWSMLRWWDVEAGEGGLGLPLTVWLPASSITADGDLLAIAASVLSKRTETRSPDFWKARLQRWRTAGQVRLFLIIDGLNQNFFVKNWSSLLQPIYASEWIGTVAVVLSCRPDHWEMQGGMKDLTPEPVTTELGPFTDAELDGLLGLNGMSRESFSATLVELMRVPRLFSLVLKLAGSLDGIGDVTPETLALADWRDRIGYHGNRIALSTAEFRSLASSLGSRLKKAMADDLSLDLNRRELIAELNRDSGFEPIALAGAVSELVDGRWLSRTDTHRFSLEGAAAWLAMGLCLLDVLRKSSGVGAAAVIADFVDPLRGADIGVAVLRAAATAALVEDETQTEVRRVLLDAWISSQNFGFADFEALWRLMPLDHAVFIEVADRRWRNGTFDRRQDEVMTKAFVNASKWKGVADAVDAAIRSWMSAVPLPKSDEAAADIRVALAGLLQSQVSSWATILHPEPDADGWLRACRNALVICSYRPRAPVSDAYVAWAMASAVVSQTPHGDLADWTLRLNDIDPTETCKALIASSRNLLASGNKHARMSANTLLRALATHTAMDVAEPDKTDTANNVHKVDSTPLVGPDQFAPTNIAALIEQAGSIATDPGSAIISGFLDLCRTAPDDEFTRTFLNGVDTDAITPLARWVPEEIDPFMRRVAKIVSSKHGEGVPQIGWLTSFYEMLASFGGLLCDETRAELVEAFSGVPHPRRPHWLTGSPVTALACYMKSSEEQVSLIAADFPNGITKADRFVLKALPPELILTKMATKPEVHDSVNWIEYWLRHLELSRELGAQPLPVPLEPFIELTGHADGNIRSLAIAVLNGSRDPGPAAVAFAAGDWTYSDDMEQSERARGSLLLLKAVPALGSQVLDRADPQVSLAAFREDSTECARVGNLLQREIDHILAPVSHSSTRRWCEDEILDEFVAMDPGGAERLVQPILEPSRSRSTFLFMGFPAFGLCHGLLRHRPEVGSRLWRSLMDEQADGITKHGNLVEFPFEAPRCETIDRLRDYALSSAHNDAILGRIAAAATLDEADSWLEETVRRDLQSPTAAGVARALMLAGYSHATPKMRELWLGELAKPPTAGWLAIVHSHAQKAFNRNVDSLHWLNQFMDAKTELEMCTAYVLLASTMDGRGFDHGVRRLNDSRPQIPPTQLARWNLGVADANKRFTKLGDAREKLFGGTRVSPGLVPWE